MIRALIFVFGGLAVAIAFSAINGLGLLLFFRANDARRAADKLGIRAWILSVIGAFTGPCLVILQPVALGMAIASLRRTRGHPVRASRIPALAALLNAVLFLSTLILVIIFGLWSIRRAR